jgi:hypothetical protein
MTIKREYDSNGRHQFLAANEILTEARRGSDFSINDATYRRIARINAANSQISYRDFYGKSGLTCICSYSSIIYNNGNGPGININVAAYLGNPPAGTNVRIDVYIESNGQNEPGGGNDVAYVSSPYVVKSVYVQIGVAKNVTITYSGGGRYWFADRFSWDGANGSHYFQSGGGGHIGWHGGNLYIVGAEIIDAYPGVDYSYGDLGLSDWLNTNCPGVGLRQVPTTLPAYTYAQFAADNGFDLNIVLSIAPYYTSNNHYTFSEPNGTAHDYYGLYRKPETTGLAYYCTNYINNHYTNAGQMVSDFYGGMLGSGEYYTRGNTANKSFYAGTTQGDFLDPPVGYD